MQVSIPKFFRNRVFVLLNNLMFHLPKKDRKYLQFLSFISCLLSVLDLLAIALLAQIMTPLQTGSTVELPILGAIDDSLVPGLLMGVLILLILKNVLALLNYKLITKRVSTSEIHIGENIYSYNLKLSWALRPNRPTIETARISDYSVMRAAWTFLLPGIMVAGLLTSVLVMLVALLILQPLSAFISIVFFGIAGYIIHKWTSPSRKRQASVNSTQEIVFPL